ncbi:hypothetical protein [Fodinibius halophilus]|uniref:Diphthamide synthase domain-containing protein n=1 Tax=Fodinibius halophilus TaxID=1736908 RepID=A0A6M1SZ51_9BACT|nr:hypothetical protein [Fodinibius halophilus]NGP88556.1 hypothetical protein [Fodinibius halophilus]
MDILFWSGGKDAYLALHFYQQEHPDNKIILLTTFNKSNDTVPHQNISLDIIKAQADKLDLELITVPLPSHCSNEQYLESLQETFNNIEEPIENLIFGDWYLDDIRQWREEVFEKMGYNCRFPIWKKDINELLTVLLLKPVKVEISAVKEEYQSLIRVGEPFNQAFVNQISRFSEDIDPFGEQGEFHTQVTILEPETPKEFTQRGI